jgi:SIR2-like domain
MQFVPNGPDIPNALLQAHEEGNVVFFCGAGISYPAGLPGFQGLVDGIYKNVGEQPNSTEKEAYDRWQYDTTLNLLEVRITGGRSIVRKALAQSLKPKLRKKGATTTHAALLDLARSRDGSVHLVTTNFDRIFNYLISRHKLSITEYAAPCLPIPKNSRWNGLVYLHGLLPKQLEKHALNQLVITSGDFGLAYLTERWAARFVSDLFQNFTVCFVGYSIGDPVLRYLMDALAADRMLGEFIPEAYAFGSYRTDDEAKPQHREPQQKIEWEAKGVIPILYEAINKGKDHSALHETFKIWAKTYRDGVQGKERIIVDYSPIKPSASTKQDDYVGRMIWALSDPSGKPAKKFAEFDPVPPIEWLETFSENCFSHSDLSQFGIPPFQKPDENLKFSLIHRPVNYSKAPWMMLTSYGTNGSDWDDVMVNLASWLVRHLNNPQLLLWLTERGGRLQNQLVRMVERQLDRFAKLERDGNTTELTSICASSPHAIPSPPMRTLWHLLIAGRVKVTQENLELYSWKTKLDRDGLTTTLRFELRELLAPKIKLKNPLRYFWGEDDATEITRENIKRFIDWDVVLAADNLKYYLKDLQKLAAWPEIVPELLSDIQQLLLDALDLQRELGEADDLNDRSNWYLPSISPHSQNHDFNEWISLIKLLRDAWLTVQQSHPARATKIARDWFEQPYPTFKRLALYAATKDENITSDEWVSWLLVDDCWWLWTSDTRRETMRVLVLQGQNLSYTELQRLEAAILAGPLRKMYREDLEFGDWQELQAHSIWLHLAKLKSGGCVLGNDAAQKLANLSAAYPNWQLPANESDEFSSWISGTGDPDFEERHPIVRVPRQLDKLVIWLKQDTKTDPFSGDDWRDVCEEKFATVVRAFYILSQESFWPSHYWEKALYTWSDEKRVRHCWRYVAPLVAQMPDDLLLTLNHSVTWWLESASKKKLNCHEDLFFDLCRRYLAIDYPDNVDRDGDALSLAMNDPIGHITEALIKIWFLRQPNDGDGIPDDIKPLLTKLCGREKAQYRHGRVILASRLISLFRIDRVWTEQYLIPFLSWQSSESEARATWTGFLRSPRIYWPLMTAFKNDFLETAKYSSFLNHFGEQYINLLTFAALDPASTFTTEEYRAAISSLPQSGLEIAAGSLVRALGGAGEQREQYWQNRVRPYWQEIWPKDNQKRSTSIAENLARLSIAAGGEFPDALATFIDWLQPFNPHHILYLLEGSDLCSKFPQDVLTLLDRIIENQSWSYSDLGKCLDEIAHAWPESQTDWRYRRLQELRSRN